jgi:hypothetical protein
MHISPKRNEIGRRARPSAVDKSFGRSASVAAFVRPAKIDTRANLSARPAFAKHERTIHRQSRRGETPLRRPAPFSILALRFEIPIILFCFPSVTCGGSRLFERFILPQTLRRPAPNILAAASFWRAIASPNFWPCHEAQRPCHAYFFWLGPFWSIVQRRMQKCCARARHTTVASAFHRLAG